MGATGSKKADEIVTEPRKAFSDDDIFRHSSKRGTKQKNQSNYFSNQPLRPKSAKSKPYNSETPKTGSKTPTNGKSSIWNRKSKREKPTNTNRGYEHHNPNDYHNNRHYDNGDAMENMEPVNFTRLNKFHESAETEKLWNQEENADDWNAVPIYRSYDCLNANSALFQDPHLSKSFNPLVSSKLPFMLSYELKPSLVAQLNSIKSSTKDNNIGCNKSKNVNTNNYTRQTSLPEGNNNNIDKRYQVDVSRYLIDSKTAKRNDEIPVNSKPGRTAQDDMFHKELAQTLAKLVDKAGTHEYRKFCSMARAYSVDFSDVYIADFLESVETLAKLAKPVSTPTVTPTASPYRRSSHTPTLNGCEIPKTPRTNLTTSSSTSSSSARRYTSDNLWKVASDPASDRSATLGPDTFSIHKRASRIPIPIGTKMIQRNQKEYQSINFITSPTIRTLRNGYKSLASVQSSSQKEVLSAIEEVQEGMNLNLTPNLTSNLTPNPTSNPTINPTQAVNDPNDPPQISSTAPHLVKTSSKCCCFCEDSLTPMERMDCEILSRTRKSTVSSSSSSSEGGSQFDVDFFYVDKDTKKPTMSFEEVMSLKRNKRQTEDPLPSCSNKPTSPSTRQFMDGSRSRKYRPISLYLLTDSSDRYVPVARLTIRKRCTCEAQMRRLCTFLENPGCCLAEVTIAECSFDPAAMLRLSKAVELNESLRILNLESCGFEDDFAMFLGSALRHNATLTRVSLAKNSFGPRGMSYLNQGLSKNLTLQDLSLDYNSISDEGCEILAAILAGNKVPKKNDPHDKQTTLKDETTRIKSSLRKLSLKANKIGPVGASAIFKALRHVTSLTELDLSGNQIDDKSVEILGNVLLFNRSLKTLKLDNCGLGWRSCEYLRRPLKTNTDLSILSLDLNQLTDLGISYLAEGLQYNRNLKELSLNMCSVTSVGLESLVSVIKSRTALRTLRLCYNDISIADNNNAGFVGGNHVDLNNSFGEYNKDKISKKDQNLRTSQALNALDRCLRESQKNLVDESLWYASDSEPNPTESTRYSAPPASRHQGLSKNSFNSSLYRKMIMALKRNPSLRIVMWGNQRSN